MLKTFIIILIFLLISLVLWFNFRCLKKAEKRIEYWASKYGYTIKKIDQRVLLKGPFSWSTKRTQLVFFVILLNDEGNQQTAFIRCSYYSANLEEDFDIKWNE